MDYELVLGVTAAIITFGLMVLRTNSAVVFFSICAGSVLANQLGNEATLLSSTVIKDGDLNKSVVYISLIFLPALLSTIFLRSTISSGKLFLNLVPSLAASGLLLLLIVPLLPSNVSGLLTSSSAWDRLQQYQPIILVVGVVSSILLLFFASKRSGNKKHKKH